MQDLLTMGCTTRFDTKSEEPAFIDEYLSTQEIYVKRNSRRRRRRKRITLTEYLSQPSKPVRVSLIRDQE
jgi:hypothetical protein